MNSRPTGATPCHGSARDGGNRAPKGTGMVTAGKPEQQQPRTLIEAHLALARIRPRVKAPLEQWQAYYEKSMALYAEIAKINGGRHPEARYWVDREQRKAREVADAIKNGTTSWNPFS